MNNEESDCTSIVLQISVDRLVAKIQHLYSASIRIKIHRVVFMHYWDNIKLFHLYLSAFNKARASIYTVH